MPPVSRSKVAKWVFTWNNPTDLTLMGQMPGIHYLVCQYEVGTSGTPHVQGYVHFRPAKRFSAVRRLLDGLARWMPAVRNAVFNTAYCSKCCDDYKVLDHVCRDQRLAGPWVIGVQPMGNGHSPRVNYLNLKDDLDDGMDLKGASHAHFELYLRHGKAIQQYRLQQMEPRDFKTTVIFLYGPANSGKTYFVQSMDEHYFRKPFSHWFDGYDGQETVLYDDFLSTNYGSISGHLAAFDSYTYQPKVHFGFCQWRPRVIFLTSNLSPDQLFPQLQNNNPELVQAFWSRIEFIVEFSQRDNLDDPPIMEWKDSLLHPEWTAGYKRGH